MTGQFRQLWTSGLSADRLIFSRNPEQAQNLVRDLQKQRPPRPPTQFPMFFERRSTCAGEEVVLPKGATSEGWLGFGVQL